VVRLTDGTSPVNVTISGAANDSGIIAQNYAAGTPLTLSVANGRGGLHNVTRRRECDHPVSHAVEAVLTERETPKYPRASEFKKTIEENMNTQNDVVALVNISTQKWPPRHRTYFGSLEIRTPEPGEAFAVTPISWLQTASWTWGTSALWNSPLPRGRSPMIWCGSSMAIQAKEAFTACLAAAGPLPTEAELAEAHRKLDAFHRRLVDAADLEGSVRTIRCSSRTWRGARPGN